LDVRHRLRRSSQRVADAGTALGRRLGLVPYAPERWTPEQWTAAYGAGQLEYYAGLDEMARYSVLTGYVRWIGRSRAVPPRLLDVGCGTGLLRSALVGVQWSEYVGVDVSDRAIAEAAARPSERSRFVVGDVMTLDLGRFDIVVANEVLYYAADPRAFLHRLRACLAPGGYLLVSMWRHPGDHLLWDLVDEVVPILDRVDVRNRANAINRRGWIVACCGPVGVEPPSPG
jgi:2-polyprenyl-6-hydroxyphenyl methylase/3-demethylubiquinone-9 3-methyltransferase